MRGLVLVGGSSDCADMYYASRFLKMDPFVYLETDEQRIVVVDPSEVARVRVLSGADEVWDQDEFVGLDDAMGTDVEALLPTIVLGAVGRAGLATAVVPDWFPTRVADLLRAHGVQVEVDPTVIRRRRRWKTPAEVEAIEATLRVAEESMGLLRRTMREAAVDDEDVLRHADGSVLTSERLQNEVRAFWATRRCEGEVPIIAGGGQAADGFETGHGPLRAHTPITCDLFPRHTDTRYHADITRVFCVGEPPTELVAVHESVRRALELARSLVRPGVRGSAVFEAVCEQYHAEGYGTPLHQGAAGGERAMGAPYLGHGLGLDVHELETGVEPYNGGELHEGDVITLEPELYRLGWGAVRLEDAVLVTADGSRTLTRFDYDLD
jgi:Xaa-Pro aminopeptidase